MHDNGKTGRIEGEIDQVECYLSGVGKAMKQKQGRAVRGAFRITMTRVGERAKRICRGRNESLAIHTEKSRQGDR